MPAQHPSKYVFPAPCCNQPHGSRDKTIYIISNLGFVENPVLSLTRPLDKKSKDAFVRV